MVYTHRSSVHNVGRVFSPRCYMIVQSGADLKNRGLRLRLTFEGALSIKWVLTFPVQNLMVPVYIYMLPIFSITRQNTSIKGQGGLLKFK